MAQVRLANFGPVLEWDDDLGGGMTQVVGLAGEPYLLRPLSDSGWIWRSLTPLAAWGVDDRVDYTNGRYRLHLGVRSGAWGSTQIHRMIFEADRSDAIEATAGAARFKASCPNTVSVTEYRWDSTTGTLNVSTRTFCLTEAPDGGGIRFNPRENKPEQMAERQAAKQLSERQSRDLRAGLVKVPGFLAKPQCRALFTFPRSAFASNPEKILEGARFRSGNGISVRSPSGGSWHPCRPAPGERPQRAVRAFTPGPFRPAVFLCDDFFGQSENERAMTVIHEMLHISGMPEDEDPFTAMVLSSVEIASLVRSACQ